MVATTNAPPRALPLPEATEAAAVETPGAPRELLPHDLGWHCEPGQLPFDTTDDLADLEDVLGQPRAVAAVELGIAMARPGYNLYALGPPGVGKHFVVERHLERQASAEPVPDDWCYVFDFAGGQKPNALRLPAGKGSELRHDMDEMVEELRTALTAAFERDDYQTRRRMLHQELEEAEEKAFQEIASQARDRGLAVMRTPTGLLFAPIRDGQALSPEEAEKIPPEERQRLAGEMETLRVQLEKLFLQVPRWQREHRDKVRQVDEEVTRLAVGTLIEEVRRKHQGLPEVQDYLDTVERDVVLHARELIGGDDSSEEGAAALDGFRRRYRVNLLVDHAESRHAPVVHEDNPTFANLIGRVEHITQMGALVTDFTLIRAGALHRANGGYLVLDAAQVLRQPFAWEGLKRTLQSNRIKVESIGQAWSLVSTVFLEPESIPLSVKVVLVGDRVLYYMLAALDPEFPEAFKVAVNFDESLDLDEASLGLSARLMATLIRKEGLKPFDRTGVARVLEHSARLAGDARKLSLHTAELLDLLREAHHWSGNGSPAVTGEDVQRAIDAQIYRMDRVRERLQEQVRRGTILLDTSGTVTGQINALSVLQLGSFAFGHPGRVTARIRLGEGEVVNIEREVELSGPIHSKGVLILAGFLGARYAGDRPLSLHASLVFEQSYGGIEGDSASLAELCALLSAIADVPIRQSLAMTGSVNQRGQAQAIGGVNEKIEGFFDACAARGLTGEQGVLIPESNVQHLMLRRDVVDAVAAGKFHVFPIATVDEALEALTGLPAGKPDGAAGQYPEGTVNRRVADRLAWLADRRMAFEKGREAAVP